MAVVETIIAGFDEYSRLVLALPRHRNKPISLDSHNAAVEVDTTALTGLTVEFDCPLNSFTKADRCRKSIVSLLLRAAAASEHAGRLVG